MFRKPVVFTVVKPGEPPAGATVDVLTHHTGADRGIASGWFSGQAARGRRKAATDLRAKDPGSGSCRGGLLRFAKHVAIAFRADGALLAGAFELILHAPGQSKSD